MATYGNRPTAITGSATRTSNGDTLIYTVPANQYAKINVALSVTFTSGTSLQAGIKIAGLNALRSNTLTSAQTQILNVQLIAGPLQTVELSAAFTAAVGTVTAEITGVSFL